MTFIIAFDDITLAPEGYNTLVILQTKRLIIRQFKPADLAGLLDMFADPEVMKYIGPRRAMTESEIQAWLSDKLHRQTYERTRYAVALKTTDELIGVAGVQAEGGIGEQGQLYKRIRPD